MKVLFKTLFLCIMLSSIQTTHAQKLLERNTFEIDLGIGKRAYINSKDGVLRGTASLNYNWRVHKIIDIKTGFDAIYWDIPYQDRPNDPGYLITSTSYEHFAYAFVLGFDLKMRRTTFQYGLGRYLYYKQLAAYDYDYYSKLGFRYQLTEHFNAGFFLRAHSYIADYIDFGIGYKF